jgi:hypothetical protein
LFTPILTDAAMAAVVDVPLGTGFVPLNAAMDNEEDDGYEDEPDGVHETLHFHGVQYQLGDDQPIDVLPRLSIEYSSDCGARFNAREGH